VPTVARGKNKAKATNRRTAQATATLAALRAELASEEALLAEAAAAAADVDQGREDLLAEGATRDRDTADELTRLKAQNEQLERDVATQRAHRDTIADAWEKYSERVMNNLGPGREGVEKFMRVIGVGGYLVDNNTHHLSTAEAVRLQKIRGGRSTLPENLYNYERDLGGVVRGLMRERWYEPLVAAGIDDGSFDRATATPEQVAAYDAVEAAAERFLEQKISARNADAIHVWHPFPAAAAAPYPDTALMRDLGVINTLPTPETATVFTDQWPTPTAALSATTRARLAGTTIDELVDHWAGRLTADETLNRVLGKHHHPLHSGPLHPRPGRAASLRHLYTKSALGTWSRSHEHGNDTYLWGLMATAFTCATAFWMPAGQTLAFADSDPLTDDDRDDLLLPFPQVFMAFAEPLEIGATSQPTTAQAKILRDFDSLVRTLRTANEEPDVSALVLSSEVSQHIGQISAADIIDMRGCRVEGLLLLGDSLGRLEDTFAWCISIPSGASGSLGRHVIPASMTATLHKALVENLVAVASWADWHEPDDATSLPAGLSQRELNDLTDSPSFRRDADRSGAGGVRVLNVRASIKTATGAAETTGRHVTPHVRRGHWRRQRYGPGRQEVRRIRIAPLVVNAHRGAAGHRVYVIPRSND
jgi:hypothetical protein